MRDINDFKFRGYDTEYEKMTYFDDEDYLLSYGQILRSKIEWNYDYDEERIGYEDVNNKIILMQYTGLHDKNGKEIYEGDIVLIDKENNIKGIVKYSEVWAEFIVVNTNSIADECEPLGDYKENIEILGNEFDNPDLLEKGAEE